MLVHYRPVSHLNHNLQLQSNRRIPARPPSESVLFEAGFRGFGLSEPRHSDCYPILHPPYLVGQSIPRRPTVFYFCLRIQHPLPNSAIRVGANRYPSALSYSTSLCDAATACLRNRNRNRSWNRNRNLSIVGTGTGMETVTVIAEERAGDGRTQSRRQLKTEGLSYRDTQSKSFYIYLLKILQFSY